MKRFAAVLTALLLGAAPVLVAAPAQAHAPYCGIRWGSTPEVDSGGPTGQVVDLRAGRHACFDRFVLVVSGDVQGYSVRYVDQVRRADTGEVVPLRGRARLHVVVAAPPMPTDAWFLPNGELCDTTGFRTFRHLVSTGGTEDRATFGLGVRARLPFRVFVLDGPGDGSRMVVDVAHRW